MKNAFDLPPQLDAVDSVVQALRAEAASVLGMLETMAFEVAMSEALTNVVVHGYKGLEDGQNITVLLDANESGLRVLIKDHGAPGPADLYERGLDLDDIDIMQESGRGLALIRHHADSVTYAPSADGSRLELFFNATA